MKKNKILGLIFILILSSLVLSSCKKEEAIDSFNLYKKAWEEKDYEKMYGFLSEESKETISKESFIERYENIFGGIGANNIKIEVIKENKEEINFSLKMDTLAGELKVDDYQLTMVEEKVDKKKLWSINWAPNLIFPQMEGEDKVRIVSSAARRGEIYDKFGNGLAINGKRYSLGIHPANYDDANTPVLAELLDIDKEIIVDGLEKNKNPEHFVPVVKLPLEEKDLLEELLEIDGLVYQEVEERIYPGGEATGSLIGYVKPITAEELEKDEDGVYTSTSRIGRFGLEEVYEKELRAIDGKEIYISKVKDGKETEKISLIKTEAQDGKDLNTSIDTDLQKKIYDEMGGDSGASVALDPKTGQVLAMVSSPNFDPNLYTSYISNTEKERQDNLEVNIYENKFNKAYSPGSTFKLITAAIGLESGAINQGEKISIKGKGWQKDKSWGSYQIKRVNDSIESLDLDDALIYSDNIYFARAALEIGEKEFVNRSKDFGFGDDIPIDYPMANSQISNDGALTNEILLADTGYGQGQVLMSPLHLALVYSSLVNQGSIMEASLFKNDDPKVWKEDVMTKEISDKLLKSLTKVIDNKNGTGHEGKLDKTILAGKTGTAELKSSQDDKGQENGWFVALDVEDPSIVIAMMVEDVADRGLSKHTVLKVKNVMEYYLENK